MSLLVDTSFVVAVKNKDDKDHGRGIELLQELVRGQHGAAVSTEVVFLEAITTAYARTHRHSTAVGVGDLFFAAWEGKPLIQMRPVTTAQVHAAWSEFRRHRDKKLSMVDWTSVVVAKDLELEQILSFDDGFDGIFPRLS